MAQADKLNEIILAARNLQRALASIHGGFVRVEEAVYSMALDSETDPIFESWSSCNYHSDALRMLLVDMINDAESIRNKQ
jgi:hypothetical protein